MVAGAFPLVKLGYLAVKQISKPLANVIKLRAKKHPFFRKYVCMPPAQIYHWMEVNVRMRMLGLGKAQSVERLSEEMAIELGAEMLGEFVIFSMAAVTVVLEYKRSSKKEALKEEKQKHDFLMLQQKLQDLDLICMVQEAQIRELQRSVDALASKSKKK
ncbi:putative OPA3-like protein CG13603 [Pomacea canaliculata]|uniref:putative OPA3-like protein CG13603 n=1 Tax=Pomacea canaliculata TaxID=400727 RepID=UPI000D73BBC3|nr:putative OPA3-like protein CG13603 [Pomacea canaliculata]